MGSTFTQGIRHLLLCTAEAIHQLTISRSLIHGVKIGPLNILNDRNFKHFCIVKFSNDYRNFMDLRQLRGPPPALACNDLERVRFFRVWANDKRLDDATLRYRSGKLFQLLFRKCAARLIRVGLDPLDGNK